MSFVHAHTGSRFLDALSLDSFNLLRPSLMEVTLSRDDVLCLPGAALEAVWFPITAILSVITLLADGQGVEACTIGHESAYGLLNAIGSPYGFDRVIAQAPGKAIRMRASRLRATAAISVTIADLIVRHAQVNAAQVQQSVACNAVHGVEQRLSRWLLMTQDRTSSDRLPLTQEFLGLMLGVQRSTISVVAAALQRAGLIRYARGRIDILDRRGLAARACECYGSVVDKQSQILESTGDGWPAAPDVGVRAAGRQERA